MNSFFTFSHFLLLVTTFSHLCPKPHTVSSNVAKLALSANYLAISQPVSAHFCGGKKWQVTTANPSGMQGKKITPIISAEAKSHQADNMGAVSTRLRRMP
ncbi:hypothetical protein [Desulfovibrio sp. QI0442]